MKFFYCPEKDASLVPWDSLSPSDQTFLRDKYPDAGQGAVCNLCVRSARPSAFFSRRSSSTSSSAPQSLDSGLQVPSAPRVVSGAATFLATELVESGVVELSASVAESSTAATGSATGFATDPPTASQSNGPKVGANPSRPDTLKEAKQPRVLKNITVAQRVEKYGRYGPYDNNGRLYCKPCGKKMDETREDLVTKHVTSGIYDVACAKHICAGAKFVLAPGYEQREERRKVKEKEAKERADKKRKHEYVTQKWDKDRDKKYKEEVVELQRGKRRAFREDEPVSPLAELASKPSWQTILELKDPRDLPKELVFSLMEGGRPLTVVEDIRPIFRAYTPVSGHVCGTN